MACGLDWSEPVSHFPNVDYQGNVHIVRKLGEVEKLPIYLIFNSSYGISPYVGSGFEIPFLESRMWQVDENRFQMKSPSGWLWIFQRTKWPNVLEGNAGWKGLIKDDTITLWAPCGDKIVFKNGKIVSMQLKNEKFDYAYKGNQVESIQMNGRTILEVKSDDKTGNVTGISLPNTRELIGLQQTGSRPRIELDGEGRIVSRLDKTLSEVTKSDGSKERFEFGVDAQRNPTMQLNNTTVVWNSATKKVTREGGWDYRINPAANLFEKAYVERQNEKGKVELWHYNGAKGEEVVQGLDGVKKVRRWFTTGILMGQTKEVSLSRRNGEKASRKNIFDELGRIARISFEEGRNKITTSFIWSKEAEGAAVKVVRNDCVIALESYDIRNRVITHRSVDLDEVVLYSYQNNSSDCLATIERGALKFSLKE
jgi:hypothetical protein